MAINLSNVSVKLSEFQKMAKGDFNAGEVRLLDEQKLKKANNHVTFRFANRTIIPHEEVFAIKDAFVKALSANGVKGNALDDVRRELGLAVDGKADVGLAERSIKPLSRQQIREILDKHAETINSFNDENHGDVHIRTTRELYGGDTMSDYSLKWQKKVNDKLAAPTRALSQNAAVLSLSRIIANDIEFDTDAEARNTILDQAKAQFKKLKAAAAGQDENATVSLDFTTDSGQSVKIETGMTRAAILRRLEDVIARLTKNVWPSDVERESRTAFKAIERDTADATRIARDSYLEGLRTQNDGDVKARAIAVMLMSEAGITDWDTLSAVNRLSKDDAIAFVRLLVSLGADATADNIRNDIELQNLFAKARGAVNVGGGAAVCIPAASPAQFNTAASQLMFTEYAFPQFRTIADELIAETRQIYGAQVMPEGAATEKFVNQTLLMRAFPNASPDDVRATPDSFRATIRTGLRNNMARKLLETKAPQSILKSKMNPVVLLERRHPQLVASLKNANSAQEATAALNQLIEPLKRVASILEACNAAEADIPDRMLQKLANAVKMDFADVKRNFDMHDFKDALGRFSDKISMGEIDAGGAEAIAAAFDKFVDDFVKMCTNVIDKIDTMDISDQAKSRMKKAALCGWLSIKYVDMDVIKDAASTILLDELDATLSKPDATKKEVFDAFGKVTADIDAKLAPVFQKVKEVAPSDRYMSENLLILALAHKREGLFDKIANFFAKPDVSDPANNYQKIDGIGHPAAKFFMLFSTLKNNDVAA